MNPKSPQTILALVVSLLAGPWMASAPAEAPINRKFEIRNSKEGFVAYGFRAEVGAKNRFNLRPGMDAEAVRAQLRSVRWDSMTDALSEDPPMAAASRHLRDGTSERFEVLLNKPDGTVWEVTYEVAPARYSRAYLERYCRSMLGGEARVRTSDTAVQCQVAGKGQQGLHLDARLISPQNTTVWQLRYTFYDESLKPVPEQAHSQPEPGDSPLE